MIKQIKAIPICGHIISRRRFFYCSRCGKKCKKVIILLIRMVNFKPTGLIERKEVCFCPKCNSDSMPEDYTLALEGTQNTIYPLTSPLIINTVDIPETRCRDIPTSLVEI